jgi:predicted ribosomally synthesized peptide with SipW-like signal peptide
MTDGDDSNGGREFSISRRKALAGLGSIGAATVLGGVGTYAAFSDTEDASATFTAGELDGEVSWAASYNGEQTNEGPQIEEGGGFSNNEEGPYFSYNLDDVKPGDYGSVVFGIKVQTNPAWVFSCLDFSNNIDNGLNDPESEVDNGEVKTAEVSENTYNDDTTTVEYGTGELADNLYIIPFYDTNVDSSFFDSGGPPETFNPTSSGVTSQAFWDNASEELKPRPLAEATFAQLNQGTVGFNDDGEDYVTPPPVNRRYAGCTLLNGLQTSDENPQGFDHLKPYDPDAEPGDRNVIEFGYDWYLPFNVGNEVQTDKITVHFGFNFQQVRHNESPARPFISTPGYRAQGGSEGQQEGDETTTSSGS